MPYLDKLILPVSHERYDQSRENLYDRALINWAGRVNNAVVNHYGWSNQFGSMLGAKVIGANQPTWSTFRGGIPAYEFVPGATNELWLYLPIPHDYTSKDGGKFDGMVYPNIHWSTTGTDTGVARWGIEYTIARGYGYEAFPTTDTIYIEQAASGTAYTHYVAEPSEGNGIYTDGLEVDALVLMRVFRDGGHGNDTLTDSAFGFSVNLHYLSDCNVTVNRNRDSSGLSWKKV